MRRVVGTLFTLLFLVAVLGGAGYLMLTGGRLPERLTSLPGVLRSGPASGQQQPADGGADPLVTPPVLTRGSDTDAPTAGRGEAKKPLGRPQEPARTSRSYAFIRKQPDGAPVAYDPCRPIHYVVRTAQAPPGGAALVKEAIDRVSRATGLRFVADGGTTELPSQDRAAFQPARYGDRWAPVLIAWRTEKQYPALAGDTVGEGGSVAIGVDGKPTVFVTGQVVLDAPDLRSMLRTAGGRDEARGVILHELGHVVGLDHVKDRTQLMYRSTVSGVTDFGDGDRTGLAALGRGPCAPWL